MYRTYAGTGWYRAQRLRAQRDTRMGKTFSQNAFMYPFIREANLNIVDRGSITTVYVLAPGFTMGNASVTNESSTIATG